MTSLWFPYFHWKNWPLQLVSKWYKTLKKKVRFPYHRNYILFVKPNSYFERCLIRGRSMFDQYESKCSIVHRTLCLGCIHCRCSNGLRLSWFLHATTWPHGVDEVVRFGAPLPNCMLEIGRRPANHSTWRHPVSSHPFGERHPWVHPLHPHCSPLAHQRRLLYSVNWTQRIRPPLPGFFVRNLQVVLFFKFKIEG